jgi:hypothetical protein
MHKVSKAKLRFIDIMIYAPVGELKTFVKSFGDEVQENKGTFPYDVTDIHIDPQNTKTEISQQSKQS